MAITPDELRTFELFSDLTDDEAGWIAARCTLLSLAPGDVLFRVGEPADWMYVTLEGAFEARRDDHGSGAPAFAWRAGEIVGVIPFSRMVVAPSTGRALTAGRVAAFPKAGFGALLERIPRLESRFVTHLADRVREATRRDQQQEKLAALGRLAAGLAHELNNPTAAVRRFAGDLRRELDALETSAGLLATAGVTPRELEALHAIRSRARDRAGLAAEDSFTRSDREDALVDWLADVGAAERWVAAGTLADARVTVDDLAAATGPLAAGARAVAVAWLGAGIAADSLLAGIVDAAGRITELVASVKTYTHMDRGSSDADLDLRAGLDSTLALFAHRLRQRGIELQRSYADDLPRVSGRPGELNQVWTNLIDNATDAATTRVTVRTMVENGAVVVEVADDGPGVPAELRDRIWEPFFTTKAVGQGTGLGLDIARRLIEQHGGELTLSSVPGNTRFRARLPAADPRATLAARPVSPAAHTS